VLFVIARVFVGINLWHFIKYTREEFALALGTASSESVLPRIINKLENLGAAPAAVGFVIPTGYSFNLDGASIYLSLATVFIAQALGVELGLVEQLTIIGVLILSSKGMAGVPGSAFLALSATAAAVGAFPVAAVALMLGPDRFMDSMRVATNLLGNCVATLVVARWEGLLDRDRMHKVLSGEIQVGEDVPPFDEELEELTRGRGEERVPAPCSRRRSCPRPADRRSAARRAGARAGRGTSRGSTRGGEASTPRCTTAPGA
jgi:aerobic C4-dicarboxylate transport protein